MGSNLHTFQNGVLIILTCCLYLDCFTGPCKIPVKKAVVLYNGEKKRVQNDLKDGVQHGETVSFFCKNKEKSCAYTVPVPCVDGNLTLPACFKGMS